MEKTIRNAVRCYVIKFYAYLNIKIEKRRHLK